MYNHPKKFDFTPISPNNIKQKLTQPSQKAFQHTGQNHHVNSRNGNQHFNSFRTQSVSKFSARNKTLNNFQSFNNSSNHQRPAKITQTVNVSLNSGISQVSHQNQNILTPSSNSKSKVYDSGRRQVPSKNNQGLKINLDVNNKESVLGVYKMLFRSNRKLPNGIQKYRGILEKLLQTKFGIDCNKI